MKKDEIDRIIDSVKRVVESEKLAGIKDICFPERPKGVLRSEASPKGGGSEGRKHPKGAGSLKDLEREVLKCQRCSLSRTRTHVVFGEGSPKARLMFIGEAPGYEEDRQARPFVGRAGQLLTKIIESIGLRRKDVFIGNILKCRPPENRNPMPSEIASCKGYLEKQIDFIKPEVICALGKFAAQTLLTTETPISRLRGTFHDYRGVKLMPTYHPAYLLRNPGAKKEVWIDMRNVARELGLEIPKRRK